MNIPFHVPYTSSESAENVKKIIENPEWILSKHYTNLCNQYFQKEFPGYKAFMTSSCTRAMEMIALFLDLKPGDEIILPSFTFVGVANAFVNYGARLVFADIEPDSMNIYAEGVKGLITSKTKAVIAMHYGGVACKTDALVDLCFENGLLLIEDNAQGINCTHNERLLGSYGDFSCISFDSMKNVNCSEGGLLLYKEKFHERIAPIFHNGTDRAEFDKGNVEMYQWVTKGSKFAISEYNAAVLLPLLEMSHSITNHRKERWQRMYDLMAQVPEIKKLLPKEIAQSGHRGHVFFIKCPDRSMRKEWIHEFDKNGVVAQFHYTPLHESIMARKLGFTMKNDVHTSIECQKLLRLPMHNALTDNDIDRITNLLKKISSSY